MQSAHTRFRTLAQLTLPEASDPRFATTRASLVEAVPTTGGATRYAATSGHLAHPIIGDATHGKGPLNRWWAQRLGQQRLWLHALRLSLPHPLTGEMLHLHSGLPLQPAPGSDVAACPHDPEVPEAPSLDWQRLQADWPWQWLKTPRPHPVRSHDGNPGGLATWKGYDAPSLLNTAFAPWHFLGQAHHPGIAGPLAACRLLAGAAPGASARALGHAAGVVGGGRPGHGGA